MMTTVTPYERLGGEAVVRRLVNRFYGLMDTLPEARGIRALHPADLGSSREKLFKFLSGWLGGRPCIWKSTVTRVYASAIFPFPLPKRNGMPGCCVWNGRSVRWRSMSRYVTICCGRCGRPLTSCEIVSCRRR